MPAPVHVTSRVTTRAPRAPRALLAVFALLTGLGGLALWAGIPMLFSGEGDRRAAVGPLLIGCTLIGVGLGGGVMAWRQRGQQAVRERLRAQYPGQPWAWREDWTAGRVRGAGAGTARVLIVAAVVWNAFTWPVAWLFLSRETADREVYVILLFPAAGLLLAYLAAHSLLAARRHGQSYFALETTPGAIGRALRGHVETSLRDVPPEGVDVYLQCDRIVRTRSVGTRTETRQRRVTCWKDHVTVEPDDLLRAPSGLRIPVAFEIPVGQPPSDDADPDNVVLWTLSVTAQVPGVDYSDSFEVPVFVTGDPPLSDAEREALRSRRRARAKAHVPATPLFRVGHTPRGGQVFTFTPRTGVRQGAAATLTTAGIWAGAWWLYDRDVTIGAAIAGGIALLLTVGTAVALFHRSSVEVEGDTVTLRHRILGVGTTRRFERRRVTDVRTRTVGEGNAQSFEVEVHVSGGGAYSGAAHFTTQRDADWVAEQLRAAITGRG